MKKVLFGIFAHPDDESFGPSGTLIKETRENNTAVHIITLTAGEEGTNPDNHEDLGAVRLEEWRKAGALMGVSSQHHLGYRDGWLSNHSYHEIADKISAIVEETLAGYEECEIEFMSTDLNGITGHIDHIVAARVACYVFFTHKSQDKRYTRIRLACLPSSILPTANLSWLYMEPGRLEQEIDEVTDATSYHNEIVAVMRAHHSQREDCENAINSRGDKLGMNHFIVKT